MSDLNIPIAKQGWPFIIGAALIFLVLYLIPVVALKWIFFIMIFIMIFFFRDPEREITAKPNQILATADGRIAQIKRDVLEEEYLKEKTTRISIFLSPLNVHINRTPMPGVVKYLDYHEGSKLYFTFQKKASELNEHSSIGIENEYCRIFTKQIVGPIVRRVIYWIEKGQELEVGQRIGLMKFGSRMDIFIPSSAKLKVREGDKVRAGLSVIAEIKDLE